MRKFRLFALTDKASDPSARVDVIHDAERYRRVRSGLGDSYEVGASEPNIRREATMRHICRLWGYHVRLEETPPKT
jgi:stage V sporulation protein R